jgi:transcriptional regulator NrdR family protein
VFDNGDPSLRRRRECEDCSQRVTTYEVLADKLGDIGGMDREKGDRVKALMRIKDIIDRMLKAEYPGSLDT